MLGGRAIWGGAHCWEIPGGGQASGGLIGGQ